MVTFGAERKVGDIKRDFMENVIHSNLIEILIR
jgi:hypothetical protein